MNKIQILPAVLSNRIAAGEVIVRPESVIKELVENSIDASAKTIEVIVKDAGKTLLQVTDDGTGMAENDALISFLRHSTSKIRTYSDLENIKTLGFRGEALASIAAISQLEINTKTKGEETSTLLKIEGNEITEKYKSNHHTGTTISVKNLFYNTPGRRNFLKTDQTELRHIYETFIRLAISHYNINFSLVNNSAEIFKLRKSTLKERIKDIFGEEITENLIVLDGGNSLINISGYISKPNFIKKTRSDQFFYLNNRFILNRNLNYAVYSAYDDLIEKGNYPTFIIFITTDPTKVDVNVHPSKLEVKFEEEGAVFGIIRKIVRDTLNKNDLTFDVGFQKNDNLSLLKSGFQKTRTTGRDSESEFLNHISSTKQIRPEDIFTKSDSNESKNRTEPQSTETELFPHSKSEIPNRFNVWQYKNKYIIYETDTGLMIIDQHAAHERILYEKALKILNSNSGFSQQLMIPVTVSLSKIDMNVAKSLEDDLIILGFNFKFLKDDKVLITGVPPDIPPGRENSIFLSLIEQYREYEVSQNLEKRDNLAKSFACRNAVKTGDSLQNEEMVSLIDNLFESEMPFVCPHGRPTVIRITLEELDKRFSRT